MVNKIDRHSVHDIKKSVKSLDTFDLFVLRGLAKQNYNSANRLYEAMDLSYQDHLQNDLKHFEEFDYLKTKLIENKYLKKEYLSRSIPVDQVVRDFTLKDKLKYYSGRVNNKKLTEGQRRYAQMFLKKYK